MIITINKIAGKLRKTKQKEILGNVLDKFKGFFTAEELYAAANKNARALYERHREKQDLGEIASSDGHSFFEVGGRGSILRMPVNYSLLTSAEEVREALEAGIRHAIPYQKTYSPLGFAVHAGLIGGLVVADKVGVRRVVNKLLISSGLEDLEAKTGNF